MWLHIDAAYAGSAFVCPEFRKWMQASEEHTYCTYSKNTGHLADIWSVPISRAL